MNVASKYKNIGSYAEKDEANAMIPAKKEKGTFETFERKYLKPIFAKAGNEELEMTYSMKDPKKHEELQEELGEAP